jgi:hypothetical protein
MRRLATSLVAACLIAACAGSGEPFDAAPTPTTTPPTDAASLLANERAVEAAALIPALLACPSAAEPTPEPFRVAYVSASRSSRALITALPLPDLGDEVAQIRALVDDANACPGRDIELHIHSDYALGDDGSIDRICDDVVRNEHNDLVIARGVPTNALACVFDTVPTLLIGAATAEQLRGSQLTVIGPEVDHAIESALRELEAASLIEPDATVGVLHRTEDGDVASTMPFLVRGGPAPASPETVFAALEFDRALGCQGLDDAVDRFEQGHVEVVVSMLDSRCLSSAALALKRLRLQWVLTPLGVGNGDDAISTISAIGDTLDGALTVTATPRGAIRDLVPGSPPALGEGCNAITAAEGEDYEFGIAQYQSVEELCLAVAIVRAATQAGDDPDSITAAIRSHTRLPMPNNLLGGFGNGRASVVDDVVYVQQYEASCACWRFLAGPIDRDAN